MQLELQSVAVKKAFPAFSLQIETGQVAYVTTTTDQRPTVLGIIASGRMKATSGKVILDGVENRRQLRRRSALIDAPVVSAPVDDVWFLGLVSEEITFAGQWGGIRSVLRWIDDNGMRKYARTTAANLPPTIRIKALVELASLREETDLLVLVSPDRHGAKPDEWWPIIETVAKRGFAILVIVGEPTGEILKIYGAKCAGKHDNETDCLDNNAHNVNITMADCDVVNLSETSDISLNDYRRDI